VEEVVFGQNCIKTLVLAKNKDIFWPKIKILIAFGQK
jgi:hypothetical protein